MTKRNQATPQEANCIRISDSSLEMLRNIQVLDALRQGSQTFESTSSIIERLLVAYYNEGDYADKLQRVTEALR